MLFSFCCSEIPPTRKKWPAHPLSKQLNWFGLLFAWVIHYVLGLLVCTGVTHYALLFVMHFGIYYVQCFWVINELGWTLWTVLKNILTTTFDGMQIRLPHKKDVWEIMTKIIHTVHMQRNWYSFSHLGETTFYWFDWLKTTTDLSR
jgi:hypothetical protein